MRDNVRGFAVPGRWRWSGLWGGLVVGRRWGGLFVVGGVVDMVVVNIVVDVVVVVVVGVVVDRLDSMQPRVWVEDGCVS